MFTTCRITIVTDGVRCQETDFPINGKDIWPPGPTTRMSGEASHRH